MRSSVAGHCPACGRTALRLNGQNEVVCGWVGCLRPKAATEILCDREIHHVVTFTDDGGYTIRHPLSERLDDALMDCPLQAELVGLDAAPMPPGRYRALLLAGLWAYSRVAEGGDRG